MCALALLGPTPALASGGTTTSAGDQQYFDPLTNTNTTPAPSTSPPASPSTTPSPTPPPSTSQPVAPSPATASTTPGDAGRTLPYTGLNVGLVAAVGLGLLGAGLLLRRLTRRV